MATAARAARVSKADEAPAWEDVRGPGAGEGAPVGARGAVLERLRAQLARMRATPRRTGDELVSGLPELDELCLFRAGRVVELCGEEASGRASLALRLVGGVCQARGLAAWVDGPGELYPPAAEQWEIDLRRLLIVRSRAQDKLVWATLQLARSGAFALVVLDVTHTGLRLGMLEAKKLIDAARAGGTALLVLTSAAAPAQGVARLLLESAAPPLGPRRVSRELDAGSPRRSSSSLPLATSVAAATLDAAAPAAASSRTVELVDALGDEAPGVRLALVHGGTSRELRLPRSALGAPGRFPRAASARADGLELPRIGEAGARQLLGGNARRGRAVGHLGFGRPGRDGSLRLEAARSARGVSSRGALSGGGLSGGALSGGALGEASSRAGAPFGPRAWR